MATKTAAPKKNAATKTAAPKTDTQKTEKPKTLKAHFFKAQKGYVVSNGNLKLKFAVEVYGTKDEKELEILENSSAIEITAKEAAELCPTVYGKVKVETDEGNDDDESGDDQDEDQDGEDSDEDSDDTGDEKEGNEAGEDKGEVTPPAPEANEVK